MAGRNISVVIRYLQQLAGSARASGASDAELLERYVRHRDEAAFELLLWRHGTLVFNVCRRILPCQQDAEDAFQATFLAFVRKAGSISRHGSVASWLYKVAYRVALEARERARKNAVVEKRGGERLAVQSASDPLGSDVRPILDDEVNRLPERLRRPIVLCYLEGRSNAEAARELGCRLGTIYSRLARGREMLRRRLLRRGVTLSVAGLTAALTACAVEATPAILLMRTTVQAALSFAGPSAAAAVSPQVAALAEGVLRTMFVTKLKIAAVMLFVATVLTAGGVLSHGLTAAPQPEAKAKEPPPKPKGDDKKDAKPIAVKVVKPKKGGLPRTFVWQSEVHAAQRQQLIPMVSGTVKKVAVDIGDRVKKGQVLIVLDAPLLTKDVELATAALEMAQARKEEAEITVANVKQVVADGLARKFKLGQAQAALKAANANVRLAQATLDKARIQEGFTRLRAEFDGVVAERHCDPGNLVQGGGSAAQQPLLSLVRVDRVRVLVDLPLNFASVAERGDPVELSVDGVVPNVNGRGFDLRGEPKDFIPGKIARISP
ncbi:MAG: efflux RND transporter periplasmic adaptor subunit, partial [Gemmataceae bacterium]